MIRDTFRVTYRVGDGDLRVKQARIVSAIDAADAAAIIRRDVGWTVKLSIVSTSVRCCATRRYDGARCGKWTSTGRCRSHGGEG